MNHFLRIILSYSITYELLQNAQCSMAHHECVLAHSDYCPGWFLWFVGK